MAAQTRSLLNTSKRKVLLSRQIVQLALQEDWQIGHHLVELKLVETLRVSRSPVRSALKLLSEQGVLTVKQNHGYFLAMNKTELSKLDLKIPRTEEEELYVAMIRNRVKGKDTQTFTQSEILKKHDVKRTVLVNTLNRMSDEGLIVRNTGQGWSFVPTLDSIQSRKASYEFRLSVEPAGIRSSAFKVDFEALTKQRHAHVDLIEAVGVTSANPLWIYEVDANFHETIASFSGNQFFLGAIKQQNRLRRILELWDGENLERVGEWCEEHIAVINALERGNISSASNLMAQHLTLAANSTRA